MNYNEIVDEILVDYIHPCDAEIPIGKYRRVKWEQYNPEKTYKQPNVGEEWDTEMIDLSTKLYDINPFGHKSTPLGIIPEDPVIGVYSQKIGYLFSSQSELEAYVLSIGGVLLNGNDWYGADISKQHLFKNSSELMMYKLENSGGVLRLGSPYIDIRTMMEYDTETGYFSNISYSGLDTDQKTKYLRHYEDKPCTYVGFLPNLPVDTSIPGIPTTTPPSVGNLPDDIRLSFYNRSGIGCIPVTASFPYTEVCSAVVSSLGQTRKSLKAAFDNLPGLSEATEGDFFATMYDNLCVAAEETFAGAMAISQYALQAAIIEFKKIISIAFNIVGGGWDMISNFLPSLSILGVDINISDLVFSNNAVNALVGKFKELMGPPSRFTMDEIIDSIYNAMGTAYDYAANKVKVLSRDLVDAVSVLYDWCISQFQSGCVALCKLLGDIAQIWSIPPLLPGPNPVWIAIKAVREIFEQIPPLDIIMSGNFPGFTGSELYEMVMVKVNETMDTVRNTISYIQENISFYKDSLFSNTNDLSSANTRFSQYLDGMWEEIKEETTTLYESTINALNQKKEELEFIISELYKDLKNNKEKISDLLGIGIDSLKNLPIMSSINSFFELCGVSVDDILNIKEDIVSGASTIYDGFVGGLKSIKDLCYTIYNQISTLALSKVTQWVNKLIGILGLGISFPSISICVPVITF